MSTTKGTERVPFADASSPAFSVRWRGRENGPFAGEVIEKKLAANELGLLHEVQCNGQWLTIRDYLVQREAAARAQRETEQDQDRAKRQRDQALAREEEEKKHSLAQQKERRKEELRNNLLHRQTGADLVPRPLEPARGGLLLTVATAGLILPPVAILAWIWSRREIIEMQLGERDPQGRTMADWAHTIAIMGVCVWIIIGGLWASVHFGRL